MIKLTIIGAGSAVFTKNIVVDLMHIPQFKKMHISLMDIDESRLKLAKELIDTVSNKLNANPKVTLHTDRKEALRNADFVQTTIQVGGYKPSTVIDFDIPKKYGLKQTIADTLGIGGIMRGLRTIPILHFLMSRHPSFKPPGGLTKKRNVLKRFERVELLRKRGQWKEGDRVVSLVKTKPED